MDAKLLKFFNKQSKNIEKMLKNFYKIKIVFDRDVDGLMACIIVSNVLKKLNKKIDYISSKSGELVNLLEKINDKESLYIFLDISLEEEYVRKIQKKDLKCIWIDHHQLKVFSSKKILFINPLFVNSDFNLPTSGISYFMFDRIYHLEESIVFAAIGIVADRGYEVGKIILEKCKQKFGKKFNLEEIAKKLNSLFILNMKIEKHISQLTELKTYESEYLDKFYKKAQKVLENEIKKTVKNKKKINNFILFKTTSKYNVRGVIANILSENSEFSKNVIIVYELKKNDVIISLRNGKESKVNLFEFLKYLKNKIKLKSFGGHKNACGAVFSKKEFKNFLLELKKYGGT